MTIIERLRAAASRVPRWCSVLVVNIATGLVLGLALQSGHPISALVLYFVVAGYYGDRWIRDLDARLANLMSVQESTSTSIQALLTIADLQSDRHRLASERLIALEATTNRLDDAVALAVWQLPGPMAGGSRQPS